MVASQAILAQEARPMDLAKRYLVKPGSKVDLDRFDPDQTDGFEGGKKAAEKRFLELNRRLEVLQERLWAEGRHKLLVVLQGLDASGKDGTIRKVFEGVNPLGVRAESFKVPTPEEAAHDFLWRVHAKVPGRGQMVIFNRSHYEDVLVVRVHELVPKAVWKDRYRQINDFERMLAETGTTIVKFFLHISRDEQKQRLQDRLDDPAKRWKFRKGDLEDRAKWDDFMRAYEDAMEKTSQLHAPWYRVPGDRNWFRNLVVASVLVDTLDKLKLESPEPAEDLRGVVIE
jgi:PPK2 family polyphosphate:nucleotide phosphotransferase